MGAQIEQRTCDIVEWLIIERLLITSERESDKWRISDKAVEKIWIEFADDDVSDTPRAPHQWYFPEKLVTSNCSIIFSEFNFSRDFLWKFQEI
jgi:hypothetical protein